MAHRAIREFDGKKMVSDLLAKFGAEEVAHSNRVAQVNEDTEYAFLVEENPWLETEKLVVKPDQLIKRRGNNNLLLLNADFPEVRAWIDERMNKEITIDDVTGVINNFVIEPFIPHEASDEYYVAIHSERDGDEILFYKEGGVDVGDIDAKANRLKVPVLGQLDEDKIESELLGGVPSERIAVLKQFISSLFKLYAEAGFVYLEINPAVYLEDKIILLDLAAKLDDTAEFECGKLWGSFQFPAGFGRKSMRAERHIARLDSQSGASLKLTILNQKARIWTMVAGGGASVVYTDTIADLGAGEELANYGEYSGNPSDEESYEYAKTILELMTAEPDPEGKPKILIVGGGIANFTDVAKTFSGIIRAFREYGDQLKAVDAKIFVRRGGPNYKVGLERMREVGDQIGLPIEVYGPETHMTKIVNLGLAA